MDQITQLFDRMDSWRHLPNYQLERRADLLFSLYLPEVLKEKLGFAIMPDLIPEFPLRIGTIYPKTDSNRSFKIDYLALSTDGKQAVFVELKTDGGSLNKKQNEYLAAAKQTGLFTLLEGLLTIFKATDAKRKYSHLLNALGQMGLLDIPNTMYDIIARDSLQGITEASGDIRVTCAVQQGHIIYVQPNGQGPDIISFDDFRTVVLRHDDTVSSRFAQSLQEWTNVSAGTRPLSR
ncbi:MAG: hypothetical protein H8E73_05265 [Planctomycetes bacterium]|nr:hypothetical protein [Planctomycetota bacterium]